jgi:hypothetical protein
VASLPRARPAAPRWTRQERAVLQRLSSPSRIQDFVDGLAYRAEDDPGVPSATRAMAMLSSGLTE